MIESLKTFYRRILFYSSIAPFAGGISGILVALPGSCMTQEPVMISTLIVSIIQFSLGGLLFRASRAKKC